MGDARAEAFEHMSAGLKALLVSGAPFAEKRDVLGFEDRQGNMLAGVLPGNGEIEFVANGCADREVSAVSVNALGGLSASENRRGVGRPTNSQEKAPYEGLSKRTRFCSICRRDGHERTTCPDRGDAGTRACDRLVVRRIKCEN